MSYDFDLYTSRTFLIETPRTSFGGNVRIDGPDRIEADDVPVSYLSILGNRRMLYRIHLEGNYAPGLRLAQTRHARRKCEK